MDPVIAISPKSATVARNGQQQFSCDPPGPPDVTWRIRKGSTSGGSIDSTGLYSACGKIGVDTVEATTSDGSTATADVTVT